MNKKKETETLIEWMEMNMIEPLTHLSIFNK